MVLRFVLVPDPYMGIPVRKATQSYEPGDEIQKTFYEVRIETIYRVRLQSL